MRQITLGVLRKNVKFPTSWILILYPLCTYFSHRTLISALFAVFTTLLAFTWGRRRGRPTAKRRRETTPQRTAQGISLCLTVCLEESVKLGFVLSDVLLLLPVDVLCLTTLGFEVSQR